ncbi:uncharacterized protein TA13980 [Theileria annulata]|uniref:Uncharacterized protein n=1 Tax=Theileria annulata TaxID=5874 RepID=Q4UET7_THEAN|nr:uncharacterized protein TA13980 [Theileria annulata]CAI74402.1 hypothetical protein, conserved [Theileria annulata]|eukprot:XP_952134.1 hypothetical protein, conserved [Theileria annulata]
MFISCYFILICFIPLNSLTFNYKLFKTNSNQFNNSNHFRTNCYTFNNLNQFRTNYYTFCTNIYNDNFNIYYNTNKNINNPSNERNPIQRDSIEWNPNVKNANVSNTNLNNSFGNGFKIGSYMGYSEPLIFTQCSDPGKEHEVVVSDSQTHGINKVIHDVRRRNNTNKPIFPVGSHVFIQNGPNNCGTVLFNKFTQIAKPYQVLIALDCRNNDGLIKENYLKYHGTSHWIPEHYLTIDSKKFSNYQNTRMRKNVKPNHNFNYQTNSNQKMVVKEYNLIKRYNDEILLSFSLNKIISLYQEANENHMIDDHTDLITLVQIARVFNLHYDSAYRNFTDSLENKQVKRSKFKFTRYQINFLILLTSKIIQKLQINQSNVENTLKNIHYNTLKNIHYNTLKNIHDNTLKNIHDNTLQNIEWNTLRNMYENIKEKNYSINDYIKLMWSSGMLLPLRFIRSKLLEIFRLSEEKITFEDISKLELKELMKILHAYSFNTKNNKHLFNIFNIINNIPIQQIDPQIIILLIRCFDKNKLDFGTLSPLIIGFVNNCEDKISKFMAGFMIKHLKNFQNFKPIIDKLFSIIFSHEGDHNFFNTKDFYYILCSCIGNMEMFEKFEKLIYSMEIKLEPFTILKSLLSLRRTTHYNMISFLIKMALKNIEEFSSSELNLLLKSVNNTNIPKDSIIDLYNKYMSIKGESIDYRNYFILLNFIYKHSLPFPQDIIKILNKLNEYNEFHISDPVFSCIELLEKISKKYEIDIYKVSPRFVESLLNKFPTKKFLLPSTLGQFIYYISEIAPELLHKSISYNLSSHNTMDNLSSHNTIDSTMDNLSSYSTVDSTVDSTLDSELANEQCEILNKKHEMIHIKALILLNKSMKIIKESLSRSFNDTFLISIDENNIFNRTSSLQYNFMKWPILFLYLTVKNNLINEMNFPREKLLNYLNFIKEGLTNLDLNLLKSTLDLLKLDTQQFNEIIQSIPKGINHI